MERLSKSSILTESLLSIVDQLEPLAADAIDQPSPFPWKKDTSPLKIDHLIASAPTPDSIKKSRSKSCITSKGEAIKIVFPPFNELSGPSLGPSTSFNLSKTEVNSNAPQAEAVGRSESVAQTSYQPKTNQAAPKFVQQCGKERPSTLPSNGAKNPTRFPRSDAGPSRENKSECYEVPLNFSAEPGNRRLLVHQQRVQRNKGQLIQNVQSSSVATVASFVTSDGGVSLTYSQTETSPSTTIFSPGSKGQWNAADPPKSSEVRQPGVKQRLRSGKPWHARGDHELPCAPGTPPSSSNSSSDSSSAQNEKAKGPAKDYNFRPAPHAVLPSERHPSGQSQAAHHKKSPLKYESGCGTSASSDRPCDPFHGDFLPADRVLRRIIKGRAEPSWVASQQESNDICIPTSAGIISQAESQTSGGALEIHPVYPNVVHTDDDCSSRSFCEQRTRASEALLSHVVNRLKQGKLLPSISPTINLKQQPHIEGKTIIETDGTHTRFEDGMSGSRGMAAETPAYDVLKKTVTTPNTCNESITTLPSGVSSSTERRLLHENYGSVESPFSADSKQSISRNETRSTTDFLINNNRTIAEMEIARDPVLMKRLKRRHSSGSTFEQLPPVPEHGTPTLLTMERKDDAARKSDIDYYDPVKAINVNYHRSWKQNNGISISNERRRSLLSFVPSRDNAHSAAVRHSVGLVTPAHEVTDGSGSSGNEEDDSTSSDFLLITSGSMSGTASSIPTCGTGLSSLCLIDGVGRSHENRMKAFDSERKIRLERCDASDAADATRTISDTGFEREHQVNDAQEYEWEDESTPRPLASSPSRRSGSEVFTRKNIETLPAANTKSLFVELDVDGDCPPTQATESTAQLPEAELAREPLVEAQAAGGQLAVVEGQLAAAEAQKTLQSEPNCTGNKGVKHSRKRHFATRVGLCGRQRPRPRSWQVIARSSKAGSTLEKLRNKPCVTESPNLVVGTTADFSLNESSFAVEGLVSIWLKLNERLKQFEIAETGIPLLDPNVAAVYPLLSIQQTDDNENAQQSGNKKRVNGSREKICETGISREEIVTLNLSNVDIAKALTLWLKTFDVLLPVIRSVIPEVIVSRQEQKWHSRNGPSAYGGENTHEGVIASLFRRNGELMRSNGELVEELTSLRKILSEQHAVHAERWKSEARLSKMKASADALRKQLAEQTYQNRVVVVQKRKAELAVTELRKQVAELMLRRDELRKRAKLALDKLHKTSRNTGKYSGTKRLKNQNDLLNGGESDSSPDNGFCDGILPFDYRPVLEGTKQRLRFQEMLAEIDKSKKFPRHSPKGLVVPQQDVVTMIAYYEDRLLEHEQENSISNSGSSLEVTDKNTAVRDPLYRTRFSGESEAGTRHASSVSRATLQELQEQLKDAVAEKTRLEATLTQEVSFLREQLQIAQMGNNTLPDNHDLIKTAGSVTAEILAGAATTTTAGSTDSFDSGFLPATQQQSSVQLHNNSEQEQTTVESGIAAPAPSSILDGKHKTRILRAAIERDKDLHRKGLYGKLTNLTPNQCFELLKRCCLVLRIDDPDKLQTGLSVVDNMLLEHSKLRGVVDRLARLTGLTDTTAIVKQVERLRAVALSSENIIFFQRDLRGFCKLVLESGVLTPSSIAELTRLMEEDSAENSNVMDILKRIIGLLLKRCRTLDAITKNFMSAFKIDEERLCEIAIERLQGKLAEHVRFYRTIATILNLGSSPLPTHVIRVIAGLKERLPSTKDAATLSLGDNSNPMKRDDTNAALLIICGIFDIIQMRLNLPPCPDGELKNAMTEWKGRLQNGRPEPMNYGQIAPATAEESPATSLSSSTPSYALSPRFFSGSKATLEWKKWATSCIYTVDLMAGLVEEFARRKKGSSKITPEENSKVGADQCVRPPVTNESA